MVPLAGQSPSIGMCKIEFDLPAGVEEANPAEVRGMLSAVIGVLNQTSAGVGDTLVNGIM